MLFTVEFVSPCGTRGKKNGVIVDIVDADGNFLLNLLIYFKLNYI